MSPTTWFVILLLIAANALYVAAEFAAVGVRRSRLRERAANRGGRLAKRLLHVVEDTSRLDRYIATCQVGITLSSLLLGAYGQVALTPSLAPVLADRFGASPATSVSVAALLVLATLTGLQVVLGELVPKSLALQFPTRTAIATFAPVHWSSRALTPFIWLLNGSALAMLRALRLPPGSHHHVHNPQEIEVLVAESRDGGLLEVEEHDRLRAALRLRRIPAQELMVPLTDVVMVPEDATMDELVARIARAPFTRLPTYRETPTDITGVLHAKDVYLHGPEPATASTLMRPVVRVPASMPGDHLLTTLRERRAQLAVVENPSGDAVGIIAFEDVLAQMLRRPDETKPNRGGGHSA